MLFRSLLQADIEGNKRSQQALSGTGMERAAQMEAERRINMTRYGFVSRTRDRDDLTLVEGIGPKIEELLNAEGIRTFQDLAAATYERLKDILTAAGNRYKMHDPATWAQQSQMAADGNWADLKKWQDELSGGKK